MIGRGGDVITFTQTEIKASSLVSNELRSRLSFGERPALFEFLDATRKGTFPAADANRPRVDPAFEGTRFASRSSLD